MVRPIDSKDPKAAESEVQSISAEMFPDGDRSFVPRTFGWAAECFAGRYRDYGAIDARYHDFAHTLQATVCLSRLLRGRQLARAAPVLTVTDFQRGLLAVLLHDTGYLKRRDDAAGTGAKYTAVHVMRSHAFVDAFLAAKGFQPADVRAVQNMISCTGINVDLKAIGFQSEAERTVGFAIGTADLLGQMAARNYVEKLQVLFEELSEAARFAEAPLPGKFAFASADQLVRNTPAFWERYVLPKIEDDFGRLHLFLNDPYPDGPNPYLQRIEENMARIRAEASSSGAKEAT